MNSGNPITVNGEDNVHDKKYKGVRQRRWGKWVSEIRIPGSRERLWLGSYSSPEAAAVAHDTAVFFLRGPEASKSVNFPEQLASLSWANLSPTSIQTVASNAGLAVDAQRATGSNESMLPSTEEAAGRGWTAREDSFGGFSDIELDDVELFMLDY